MHHNNVGNGCISSQRLTDEWVELITSLCWVQAQACVQWVLTTNLCLLFRRKVFESRLGRIFPQIIYTGEVKSLPARARRKRGGDPADYMAWVGSMGAVNMGGSQASTSGDYMARVPYRSIGR